MQLAQTLNIKTTYNIQEVINALKSNLDKHVVNYKTAMLVFEDDLATALNELNRRAIVCAASKNIDGLAEAYGAVVGLNMKKPVLAKEMYEQYISLFQKTTDETVELSMEDANAVFNDAWTWASHAKSINMAYASRYDG